LGATRTKQLADHLRLEYGLTAAEVRLCRLLREGHSLSEAAERVVVKKSTAISQLKAIFSKTGMRNQSQLMRLLVDLSAL